MLQNELYKKIFNSPVDNAVQVLKESTEKYPWFSLAHYFLLKHQHNLDENSSRKTALHFNNDLLLQFRLANDTIQPVVSFEPIEIEPTIEATPKVEEIEITPQVEEQEEVEQVSEVETEVINEPEVLVETEVKPETQVTKADTLLFEPLHTTDYFASQGIKMSEEVKPTDKLGKQLKSFTEWLKTMKKLPSTNPEEIPIDKKVEEFAENSNKDLDIYTESLAEVYLDQGKSEKARDIYKKLILLNPDKSAYFAAKLDQL